MHIGTFDLDRDVLVVAEIGNNHEGSVERAEEMIHRAAEAGAGAVKFQTCVPELFVGPSDTARLERLRRFRLPPERLADLKAVADKAGVLFFSTPLDLESARLLEPLCPVMKISSGDNGFVPLIETVADFGKPIILSTGLADISALRLAHGIIESRWARAGHSPGLAILHCVSSYPVPPDQANLGAIAMLKRTFGCTVGYSDHTLGIEAAVLSVALGARIVEKHFTLDKAFSDYRDHQLSADPAEMAQLVARIRDTVAMVGEEDKRVQDCERDGLVSMRRSIAAARDLPEGTIVGWDDLVWLRPGGGEPPGAEHRLLGRRLVRAVARGEPLRASDITGAE